MSIDCQHKFMKIRLFNTGKAFFQLPRVDNLEYHWSILLLIRDPHNGLLQSPPHKAGMVFNPLQQMTRVVDHCLCRNSLWIITSKHEFLTKRNTKIRPTSFPSQQFPRYWLSHMVGHGHLQGFPRAKRNVKETRRCRGITSPRCHKLSCFGGVYTSIYYM